MTRQQRRRRTLWMWRTLMLGLALTGNVGLAMCIWAGLGMLTRGRFA
jgi:hypothetical protein